MMSEYEQAKTIRKHLIGIAPGHVWWELDYLASLYKLAMAGESTQQESQTLEGYRREIRKRLQKLNRDLRLPPIAQELSRTILTSIERKMKKGSKTKANKSSSQLSRTP